MSQYLSERRAWERLAVACGRVEPTGESESAYFTVKFRDNRITEFGLCSSIGDLEAWGAIPYLTALSMKRKIGPVGKYIAKFRWPITPKGHAARAAFCRKQAKRCTKQW